MSQFILFPRSTSHKSTYSIKCRLIFSWNCYFCDFVEYSHMYPETLHRLIHGGTRLYASIQHSRQHDAKIGFYMRPKRNSVANTSCKFRTASQHARVGNYARVAFDRTEGLWGHESFVLSWVP